MLKKIILESSDSNSTTKSTIDLTEYTEMVIKITIDGVMAALRQFRKTPLKEARPLKEKTK